MPKLTIDGIEIEVPKGTRVLEAAKQAGIDIPYYCYHPGLSVAGNCRMCLVEIEKMPKLQISCHMQATDGMVVHTKTERVLKTRQHVLEFLLINHPVDCPVCDQAGECWLQDYYMKHGLYNSRLNENKIKKPKAVPVGPTVMLDAERCILCSRCVRFCDEVSQTSELGIANRGDHSEITVFPGKELNNPYAGNTVDICPVGALTDRDFRFKIRVWYLKSEDSICNGCSRGCNISVQYNLDRPHHGKGERVKRLKPRFNEKVNKWWMCDEGRYGYKFHDHNRIRTPLLRSNASETEAAWDDILKDLGFKMTESGNKVGVLLSPQLSNEELYLAKKIFQDELKYKCMLFSPNEEGFQDDILIRADKNPNSRGAELIGFKYDDDEVRAFFKEAREGKWEGVIVFGQDVIARLSRSSIKESLQKMKWSAFIGSNHQMMSENVSHVLPSATYVEKDGSFTNFEGHVQYFSQVLEPLGEAKSEWRVMLELARKLGIEFNFETASEIFNEMALVIPEFKELNHDNIREGSHKVRVMAAPTVPALEQEDNIL